LKLEADRKLILLFGRKLKRAEKLNSLFWPKNKKKDPPFLAENELFRSDKSPALFLPAR